MGAASARILRYMAMPMGEPPEIIGAQRPRLYSIPPAASHAQGEDAVEFASRYGLWLDDWQAWSLIQSMGVTSAGLWAAFDVCWILPRQNGKNSGLEARQLAGLFVLGEALQIHTAHEFKAASEHFLRMQALVRSSDELMKLVKPNGIRTSHGEEAIELKPKKTLIFGARGTQVRKSVAPRLRFLARSRGSGRSFTADAVYYDEAMILSDEEVSASMPTMSAVPNPQMWYTASAGYPDSIQLARVRNRGIAGTDPSLCYLEWSVEFCPELCPDYGRSICRHGHDRRDDPRSWARANPGMNIRISQTHIGREYIKMAAAGFDRERLGVGDWPVDEASWAVISEHQWKECYHEQMPRPQRITICADITPDQQFATIAIAGLLPPDENGQQPCTLRIGQDKPTTEGGLPDHRAGIDWVLPRLKELKRRYRVAAIVIDPIGPGAELIVALENAGYDVEKCNLRDVAQAHAQFLRGISDRTIWHAGQEDLGTAVASAVQRDVGDGLHAWARRDTTADISPLCAGTMAVWAAYKFGRGYDPLKSVGGPT